MTDQHETDGEAPAQAPGAQDEGQRRHPLIMAVAAVIGLALVVAGVADAAGGGGGDSARSNLTLIAPAGAGGGWDGAAREAQQAMRANGIVNNSQVVNIPGAGGTIGLNQVVNQMAGETSTMMLMGITMLGAIKINGSEATLADVTPIARLTDDYDVVVVAADSPIQDVDQLIDLWKQNPRDFPWGGGSLGSVDQMIITQLAIEVGISAPEVNYIAYSGGGQLATSLLSGTITASVSGYQDFKDQIEAGRLRALAISAPEPVESIDLPTLIDLGYDVSLTNWRGIVAPPGIGDADRQVLEDIVAEFHDTDEWRDALERNQWTDTFMVGQDFRDNIAEQTEFVNGIWAQLGY